MRECRLLPLLAIVFSLGAWPAPAASQDDPSILRIEVVEKESGKPLGADLRINTNSDSWEDATDDEGICEIDLSADLQFLRVTTEREGYVSTSAQWRRGQDGELPESLRIEVEKATTIGGVVKNEEGQPVSGATVQIYFQVPGGQQGHIASGGRATTDAGGKWEVGGVPPQVESLYFGLSHKDYASGDGINRTQIPYATFLDRTAELTIERGVTISGVVTDEAGKPLADVSVLEGSHYRGSNVQRTRTDAEGSFRLANQRSGQHAILTFTHEGRAPEVMEVVIAREMPPIRVKLGAGRTIRGKVLDGAGKPIAGARVSAGSARGYETVDWSTSTNEQGRFEWAHAPQSEAHLNVNAPNYVGVRNRAIPATESETTLTLHKPAKITGIVVDAANGDPIPQFTVIRGIQWSEDQPPTWQRHWEPVAGRDGQFEIAINDPYPGFGFRVEAPDYLPATSRGWKIAEGDTTLEFKLKKGEPIRGVVQLPDGAPAGGATVLLLNGNQYIQVENGAIESHVRENSIAAETTAQGRFTLPPQEEVQGLLAFHEAGYALLNKEEWEKAAGSISLKPWGRVEGVVQSGSQPDAGQQMFANKTEQQLDGRGHLSFSSKGTADESGRFALEKVPAGSVNIGKYIQTSDRSWSYSHTKKLDVEPGKTAAVQIGGDGRPVVGRILLPESLKSQPGLRWFDTRLTSAREMPEILLPDEVFDMNDEQRQQWHQQWMKSEEGKAHIAEQQKANPDHRNLAFRVEQDGAFRIDDVPAGDYILNARLVPAMSHDWNKSVATVYHRFTVPEIPGGVSDEALELPPVQASENKPLQVSQALPELTFPKLDGGTVDLSQFKGKHLLLNFWNVFSGDNRAQDQALKQIHDDPALKNRLAVVGVSTYSLKNAKRYAELNQIPWPMAAADPMNRQTLQQFQLTKSPSAWLIGPDGKILARDLQGPQIRAELERALEAE